MAADSGPGEDTGESPQRFSVLGWNLQLINTSPARSGPDLLTYITQTRKQYSNLFLKHKNGRRRFSWVRD